MPRSPVPSRSHAWLRVAVLALIGASAAACSDSSRINNFDFNSRASQAAPMPQQDVTGSIAARPAPRGVVSSQPLPAPSQPATVAATTGGVSTGAQGLGAYRPGTDVTGSVSPRYTASTPVQPPQPPGHWTWDGGSPVTVGYGESVESIARKHGVPASAILQTNGIRDAYAVRPGQRLVIPRYVSTAAPQPHVQTQAPRPQAPQVAAARVPANDNAHIVQPGESLIGIARKHGVTLSAIARANKIDPYHKLNIGDRITIPGGAHRPVAAHQPPAQPPQQYAATRPAPAPQVAQPRYAPPPVDRVASVPAQNARVVTPAPVAPEPAAKTAEPAGAMPSFRWPVKGRVIAGFGSRSNGTQNDGINLAVPSGTPVKAAEDGVVAYAGNELKGYGNLVLIRHANGFVSAYANASELTVKRGDSVKRGQVIAHSGQTGSVNSPQLHFEIRKGSTPVDPTKYLGGV